MGQAHVQRILLRCTIDVMSNSFDEWCKYFEIEIIFRPRNFVFIIGTTTSCGIAGSLLGPVGIAMGFLTGLCVGFFVSNSFFLLKESEVAQELSQLIDEPNVKKSLLLHYLEQADYKIDSNTSLGFGSSEI